MGVGFDKREYCYNIGYLMDNHRETQEQLALAIGVNRDRVNNWMNGRSKLDVDNLVKIAEHYKVSTDFILNGGAQTSDVRVLEVMNQTGLSEKASDNLVDEVYCYSDLQDLLNALLEDVEALKKISGAYCSACKAYNKLYTLNDIASSLNDDLKIRELKHYEMITNDQAVRFHIQDATDFFHEFLQKAIKLQFADKYGEQLTKEINEQCTEV